MSIRINGSNNDDPWIGMRQIASKGNGQFDLITAYKEQLNAFAGYSLSQEECIGNCIRSLKDSLISLDCSLSVTSKKTIEIHLENFNQTVDKTSNLLSDHANKLKIAFKLSLYGVIEKKWIESVIKSFYSILMEPSERTQVLAAQKWTHNYFEGLNYFNPREENALFTEEFIQEMQKKTIDAAHEYLYDEAYQKMDAASVRSQRDALSFVKIMQGIEDKSPVDSNSSSREEECFEFEFVRMIVDSLAFDPSDVTKKEELLKKCIGHGYEHQKLNRSIFDPASDNFFTQTLRTWK